MIFEMLMEALQNEALLHALRADIFPNCQVSIHSYRSLSVFQEN